MIRSILKAAALAAMAFLAIDPAFAQSIAGNEFQTQTAGKTVVGTVDMCINASNVAVPVSTGTCANPIPVIGVGAAAVVSAAVTRSANTTTYTANTGWNNGTPTYFTFANACSAPGKIVIIPTIDIYSSVNQTLKLQGILWLFKAIPGTIISDNQNFTIASADYANLTANSNGGIPFTLAANQASGASNSGVSLTAQNLMAQCASGVAAIYGMVQVVNAYVPANAEVLTVRLSDAGIN